MQEGALLDPRALGKPSVFSGNDSDMASVALRVSELDCDAVADMKEAAGKVRTVTVVHVRLKLNPRNFFTSWC